MTLVNHSLMKYPQLKKLCSEHVPRINMAPRRIELRTARCKKVYHKSYFFIRTLLIKQIRQQGGFLNGSYYDISLFHYLN